MTDREKIQEAFRLAYGDACASGNFGQLTTYHINRLVSLIEQVRAEERERAIKIADQELVGRIYGRIQERIRKPDDPS
jgi:hypothetical protein